ncbi:MAG TPA: hypothetical protein PK490_13735 [Prosthecobacter sp.]|nr:hypothetical protein [Prosthecobacter sp.]HRK15337.1 hypothetical protein [Prosthecobacter sp.]
MKTILPLLTALILLPLSARAVKISYAYDAAGRMTAVNYDGASRTAYGYDKNGSLLSRVSTVTPALTPPPHLAATFSGLITNASPGAANTGVITLKLLANGAYSGKLTVGAVTVSFAGSFAADGGTAVIPITGKPPLTSLDITLDVLGAVPRITGTLSGTGFNSEVAMEAVLYNSKTFPLPAGLVGAYTAVFLPTENTAGIPQGDGYATVTVKNTGAVSLAGKLADNSKLTHGSLIHGVNVWQLYIPMHKNAGFLSGRVLFAPDPGYSDFGGFISWVKPLTAGLHSGEFVTGVDIVGARYRPPLKDQRALGLMNSAPNAVFAASGGGLVTDPFTRNVTLDTKNKFVIPVDAGALKLTLMPGTGLFTGSFKDGAATRAVGGVILQTLNSGSGFFPGATESGLVELTPAP